MIFRNPDYLEIQEDTTIAEVIKSVKCFAQRIAPEYWRENIEKIYDDLTVVLCDARRIFKHSKDGELKNVKFSAAAVKFWENIDSKEYTSTQGIAILPMADAHVITHEALHAFSSISNKLENGGGYLKVGSRYSEYDEYGNEVISTTNDLNESITDALTSRAYGRVGPGVNAGYAAQVIMADLFIGENVEDNIFIQDLYFGKSEKFAEDFDKTIKTSKVKFADYLQGFSVVGSNEECQKTDEMLKGAIEYKLRKAKTSEEIDKVYKFQQKVINLYKDGGCTTNFMDTEDIVRMENLLKFADKMQKQCKSNLVAQKNAIKQSIKDI